jgi:hypothetical protein
MSEVAVKHSEILTAEQMEAVFHLHEEAEQTYDRATIMSTVSDDPHYELVSVGWRVDGRDAVTEMYRRLTATGPKRKTSSTKRVHAMGPNTLIREAYVHYTRGGEQFTGRYTFVIVFEDGKVGGERMYMDPQYADAFRAAVGEDFLEFPGVVEI